MYKNCVTIADYYSRLNNPSKFVGKRPVTMRSSWEIHFVKYFLDSSKEVKAWASEDIVIPYKYKLDGKKHRYFPDFWFQHTNGKQFLVEIKPKTQTKPPKAQKRNTAAYMRRIAEWEKNQNKWEAAEMFCEAQRNKGRQIEFLIITEKELGIQR